MLTSFENSLIQTLYEDNRIPIWIFNDQKEMMNQFISGISAEVTELLLLPIRRVLDHVQNTEFDLLYYEHELYYTFTFERRKKTFYLVGGPMLLSGFYHILEMRSLSFAEEINSDQLKSIVENLPVVSLTSFSPCLRTMMMLINRKAPSFDEIRNYKFSKHQASFQYNFLHELFENMEDYRLHTPYSHEVAVLNCVKEGNTEKLESTYRTLPQIKYGNMSNNPLRQLFYGCIANTTLITRYAIEGGLEEETAFTLSDVYIKKMEKCRTLYDLNRLNERMAIDFTERVAEARVSKQPQYIKPISKCIDYITRNMNNKITLELLSREVNLTPKYLSCLFRKETGQTLSSFIEEQKIEKAKNLLIYSEYSYSDISNYLSYYSQSYFISMFKKKVGMTPKEFRTKYSVSSW